MKNERYKGRKSLDPIYGDALNGVPDLKQQVHVTIETRYIKFLKENDIGISKTLNSLLGKVYAHRMAQQREAP